MVTHYEKTARRSLFAVVNVRHPIDIERTNSTEHGEVGQFLQFFDNGDVATSGEPRPLEDLPVGDVIFVAPLVPRLVVHKPGGDVVLGPNCYVTVTSGSDLRPLVLMDV